MDGYVKVIIDPTIFTDISIKEYCECLDKLGISWYRDANNPAYINPLVLFVPENSVSHPPMLKKIDLRKRR